MPRQFTLQRLDALFSLGKRHGSVFWRHDVDLSLFAALKMAEFEAKREVSATYYLFFDGKNPTYTVAEAENTRLQLEQLGHTVGQHIDERKLLGEIRLENCQTRISFHCPTEKVLWKKIFGFESAYESRWRNRYVSDSDGLFRYGDPEDLLLKEPGPVQVNLHAEWWFQPGAWCDLSDEQFETFFHRPRFNFVDWRRGRTVQSGERAWFIFEYRTGSPFTTVMVSPEDWDAIFERGYALIDGQQAFPMKDQCFEDIGEIRLKFERPYVSPVPDNDPASRFRGA